MINTLPTEVIGKIYDYLPMKDRLGLSAASILLRDALWECAECWRETTLFMQRRDEGDDMYSLDSLRSLVGEINPFIRELQLKVFMHILDFADTLYVFKEPARNVSLYLRVCQFVIVSLKEPA